MIRGLILLAAGAIAVATLPPSVQLGIAILGIGVVGMVHGAGDLAVVAPRRRLSFLVVYGLISLVTLLWWTAVPAVALPAFLVASAIHFGVEDRPGSVLPERVAHGVALVAAPATLHGDAYAALLYTAGGPVSTVAGYTPWLAAAGGAAGATMLVLAAVRRDGRSATGMAATLLLPPLVGFTLGFLILHALPQTAARRDRLGCSGTLSYLGLVAPVFAGALAIAVMVAMLLLRFDPSGVRGLFAGIAALAVPHLIVAPLYEERRASVRSSRAEAG